MTICPTRILKDNIAIGESKDRIISRQHYSNRPIRRLSWMTQTPRLTTGLPLSNQMIRK